MGVRVQAEDMDLSAGLHAQFGAQLFTGERKVPGRHLRPGIFLS